MCSNLLCMDVPGKGALPLCLRRQAGTHHEVKVLQNCRKAVEGSRLRGPEEDWEQLQHRNLGPTTVTPRQLSVSRLVLFSPGTIITEYTVLLGRWHTWHVQAPRWVASSDSGICYLCPPRISCCTGILGPVAPVLALNRQVTVKGPASHMHTLALSFLLTVSLPSSIVSAPETSGQTWH